MHGKAQSDMPVIVLLVPPAEHDWMNRQLVPSEHFQIQQHKKPAKVTISNSFSTVHKLIADEECVKSICSVATRVSLRGLW